VKRRLVVELLVAGALVTFGCHTRPSGRHTRTSHELMHSTLGAQARAVRHLCADLAPATCASACPSTLPARDHAECLIDYRFSHDAEALDLARALYARTGALPGVDTTESHGTYGGEQIPTRPALPVGDDRQHLEWILASFDRYEEVFTALAAHATSPIDFRLRPEAFGFFRTDTPAYPSAWGQAGVVGYNLDGPLHTSARDVLETLFHELFHLNDERRGGWSASVLGDIFEQIVRHCRDDHECLGDFAPHDTLVPDGTYYPFDRKTRDVREYGAELALRWFREHEAIVQGTPLEPPFKCRSEENRVAWERIAQDFFGGLDLSRDCAASLDTSSQGS
jgi:hypothetical protein